MSSERLYSPKYISLICGFFVSIALSQPAWSQRPSIESWNREGPPWLSALASADLAKNLFGAKNSLKSLSEKLIKIAFEERGLSKIRFVVAPSKVLSDYPDKKFCQARLKATSELAINFAPRNFKNTEGIAQWLQKLSRGKGSRGLAPLQRVPPVLLSQIPAIHR